ncbi:hypothetical protein COLO4_20859 [Corchorus olitorius]|uniref:Uncharacterized protein n=1 Tax=Corchorus olitorius TaxID=93759 RepID=A0A1R3IWK0_9ROSI|nr:hypothetical protein COLO4_20859 [Corchorus olitorius]
MIGELHHLDSNIYPRCKIHCNTAHRNCKRNQVENNIYQRCHAMEVEYVQLINAAIQSSRFLLQFDCALLHRSLVHVALNWVPLAVRTRIVAMEYAPREEPNLLQHVPDFRCNNAQSNRKRNLLGTNIYQLGQTPSQQFISDSQMEPIRWQHVSDLHSPLQQQRFRVNHVAVLICEHF